MSATDVIKTEIWEDTGATNMARVAGTDGENITQADVTSIACNVFDLDSATPGTAVSTPTVTKASSVFDTLQTDSRWSEDSTGYNFRHTILASVFSSANHQYLIEYVFTPTSGEAYAVVFQVTTKALMSS